MRTYRSSSRSGAHTWRCRGREWWGLGRDGTDVSDFAVRACSGSRLRSFGPKRATRRTTRSRLPLKSLIMNSY